MNSDQQDSKRKVAKEQVEKMVKLMLVLKKNVPDSCPLGEVLKKSFMDRVLWLEDQTKDSLEKVITQCKACGRCNFQEMLSEI
ncbi:MAG: hypothetical protein LBR92_01715 [Puniceicoccales bacterium]|jgi:hypothetical protein|nr:hypothetical protein [Puniceicoccales bacterium]